MERTCVGCQAATTRDNVVRLVFGPDGSLVADPRGGALGRGAWVHPTADCVRRAIPKGVARTLRGEVKTTADEVLEQLRAAGLRRVMALLGSAMGAKKATAGATAVTEALNRGDVALVVIARDARAAAELPAVVAAVERGQSLLVGTKAEFGAALGRPDTGVVAVMDAGIGAALRQAAALSEIPSTRGERGSKDELATETG